MRVFRLFKLVRHFAGLQSLLHTLKQAYQVQANTWWLEVFFDPFLFEIVAGIGTPAGSCCCCYPHLFVSCLFCWEGSTGVLFGCRFFSSFFGGFSLCCFHHLFVFWWVLHCAFNDWINRTMWTALAGLEISPTRKWTWWTTPATPGLSSRPSGEHHQHSHRHDQH